jgi:lysophospholipase L1-like esterase
MTAAWIKSWAAVALTAVVLITLSSPQAHAAVTDFPVVRTIAGDGIAGSRDGMGTAARFMFPVALAFDPKTHSTFVADSAAERVREVKANGEVRTVAGSGSALKSGLAVAGGYRDGPAASARFNHPSGIAVARDGSIYVADAFNHCVRRIYRGFVSTIAGKPGDPGSRDGSIREATLTEPRSLAIGSDGTLYVLDYGVGVRAVTASSVSTLPLPVDPGKTAFSIAVLGQANPLIFLVTYNSIFRYDTGDKSLVSFIVSPEHTRGLEPVAVAPVDRNTVILSSTSGESVYFVRFSTSASPSGEAYSRRIAGRDDMDRIQAGGFQDGSPEKALFFAPIGLSLDNEGNVLIADSGNRRIRMLSASAYRSAMLTSANSRKADTYRIALVGTDSTFYSSIGPDSIGALLQTRLNADRPRIGLKSKVTVGIQSLKSRTIERGAEEIADLATQLSPDVVIWCVSLDSFGIDLNQTPTDFPIQSGGTIPAVRNLFAVLSKKRIALLLVDHALGGQISDGDVLGIGQYPNGTTDLELNFRLNIEMERLISSFNVPFLATLNDFAALERGPHQQLFIPDDRHLSSQGNRFMAQLIARQLESDRPWTK